MTLQERLAMTQGQDNGMDIILGGIPAAAQQEQVQQIPIGELFPFKNHPFKVLDDESMQRTVESVEQYGVLSPLIARPRPEGG